jgi:leucyl-tRNA synthetase
MFMGPFGQAVAWNTESIIGPRRFIERVWRLAEKATDKESDQALEAVLHKTIRKVSDDIELFGFNTAISALMILANEMEKGAHISRVQYEVLLKLLAPFTPHVAEELWYQLGNTKSVHLESWPVFDSAKIIVREVTLVVQINGKVRDTMTVSADMDEEAIKMSALRRPAVIKWIEGKTITKIIFVPGKLLSIVVLD